MNMDEINQNAFRAAFDPVDSVDRHSLASAPPPLYRPIPVRAQGPFSLPPSRFFVSTPSGMTSSPLSRASTPEDDIDCLYIPGETDVDREDLEELHDKLSEMGTSSIPTSLLPSTTPIFFTILATILAYSIFINGLPLPSRIGQLTSDVEDTQDARLLLIVLLCLFCLRLVIGRYREDSSPLPVIQPSVPSHELYAASSTGLNLQ